MCSSSEDFNIITQYRRQYLTEGRGGCTFRFSITHSSVYWRIPVTQNPSIQNHWLGPKLQPNNQQTNLKVWKANRPFLITILKATLKVNFRSSKPESPTRFYKKGIQVWPSSHNHDHGQKYIDTNFLYRYRTRTENMTDSSIDFNSDVYHFRKAEVSFGLFEETKCGVIPPYNLFRGSFIILL